jgi:Asp-tRNA(Asn)/Glu-tRNA(Gln) amidotransferase A subunit family amidase
MKEFRSFGWTTTNPDERSAHFDERRSICGGFSRGQSAKFTACKKAGTLCALHTLSATEAARRIARGELTSEAFVAACLERIAERDEQLRAWAFVERDYALAQARALDRGARRGLLHGIPFGVKDVIDTAELPTEYNSPIYRGHRPTADASCVMALKLAGGVILGKTATTEFANNHPAPTRNPHNFAHTPGGSSSGSAAAVADFMVPAALGTQTGGSVIRPAAYCGVAAVKPSFGAVNRAGLKMLAESLDTIGVFARSAEDLGLVLEALCGFEGTGATDERPRVGICQTPRWDYADAATQANLEAAARQLTQAGARVKPCDLPQGAAELFDRHKVIMGYESARALAWEYATHREKISATLKARLDEGWKVTRAAYDEMRESARRCRAGFADLMRDLDFVLTPSAPGEAPAGLASTGDPVFNRAWTLLGVPCVTLPFGRGPTGLPLGVQLVGSFGADMALVGWASWAERALQ